MHSDFASLYFDYVRLAADANVMSGLDISYAVIKIV